MKKPLPAPVPAPPPGSVAHERRAVPVTRGPLSKPQLGKAVVENAAAGNLARLDELLADKRAKPFLGAAMIDAARAGQCEAIERLLRAGANIDAKTDYGSALTHGLSNGVAFVRFMLDHGADPNGPYVSDGETALHAAIEFGQLDVARALLEAGADPNTGRYMQPLQVAARASLQAQIPVEMIDLLVEHGAELDALPKPALVWAVSDGLASQAECLLELGANPDAGKPLHVAFARGNDALAKLLIEHGADRSRRDAIGLDLSTVYGPHGDDIRACTIEYGASAEPQRVEVALTLCVLLPRGLDRRDLDAAWWAALIQCGAAGGDRFAPELGRASVLEPLDADGLERAGVYERRFVLELAGVAPEFVKAMAISMLGTTTRFTGAGHLAPMRVVSVAIRGSHPAEPAPTSYELRAFGDTPFELRTERGERASLLLRANRAATRDELLLIRRHVDAWLALTRAIADYRELAPKHLQIGLHRFRNGDVGLLANVLRALHAQFPLDEVVLTAYG